MSSSAYGADPNPNAKRSVIAGVVGLALVFIPYIGALGFLFCLAAVALGGLGLRREPRKLAVVGLLLGLVPVLIVGYGAYTVVSAIQAAAGE